MKSEFNVGKDVLSYCNKCKLTLSHIIVTMKNANTIGKVQCKTCNATHAYKDPSKVKATRQKSKISKKKMQQENSISDIWMEAINNSKSKSQKYNMAKKFSLGDIIDHPKFGPGVIDRLIDNNKIQVIFRHNIKTLVHNHK